jgi:hypothetical protein
MSDESSSEITEIVSEEDSLDISLQEEVNLEGLDHENEAVDNVSIEKFRKFYFVISIKHWIMNRINVFRCIYTFDNSTKYVVPIF